MPIRKLLFCFFCFCSFSLLANSDTVNCYSTNEIIRIVSLRQIRESEAEKVDSSALQQLFNLHFAVFSLKSILENSTKQLAISNKILHVEKRAKTNEEKIAFAHFEQIIQQLETCLQNWDKTLLTDVLNQKGYIKKVLFTNSEDDTTVMLILTKDSDQLFQLELHIF